MTPSVAKGLISSLQNIQLTPRSRNERTAVKSLAFLSIKSVCVCVCEKWRQTEQ